MADQHHTRTRTARSFARSAAGSLPLAIAVAYVGVASSAVSSTVVSAGLDCVQGFVGGVQ